MRCALLFVLALCCSQAHAQSSALQVAQQGMRARQTLRDALVGLKNAQAGSCRFGSQIDCDLVTVSEVQIMLLDLESKYAANSSEGAKQVRDALDDARTKVSDFADTLGSLKK